MALLKNARFENRLASGCRVAVPYHSELLTPSDQASGVILLLTVHVEDRSCPKYPQAIRR